MQRSGRRNLVQSAVNQSAGGLDPETGQGVVTPHFFHAAAGAEVEVDLETGVVRVVDLHVETYAGKVVNPVLASLQCEGNVAFGVGQALFEEIELDGGQIVNPTLADYMIPSLRDLPERWTVGLAEDAGGGPRSRPGRDGGAAGAGGDRQRPLPRDRRAADHAAADAGEGAGRPARGRRRPP